MEKMGSSSDSPLQSGHLPGFFSRTLLRKTNPHLSHRAGTTVSLDPPFSKVFRMCSRCSHTSLSGILSSPDICLAVSGPSARRAAIVFRTVRYLSYGTTASLGFFRTAIPI